MIKKTILILTIFLICNFAFGQSLSLEETVTYINNKLKMSESQYNQLPQLEVTTDGYWIKNIYYDLGKSNKLLHTERVFALDLENQWEMNKSALNNGAFIVKNFCMNTDCVSYKNHTTSRFKIDNDLAFYVMLFKRDVEKLANALTYALSLTKKKANKEVLDDDDPFSSKNFAICTASLP